MLDRRLSPFDETADMHLLRPSKCTSPTIRIEKQREGEHWSRDPGDGAREATGGASLIGHGAMVGLGVRHDLSDLDALHRDRFGVRRLDLSRDSLRGLF